MINLLKGLVYFYGVLFVATFGCLAYSIVNVGNTLGTWAAMWQGFLVILPYLLFIAACGLGAFVGFIMGLRYLYATGADLDSVNEMK